MNLEKRMKLCLLLENINQNQVFSSRLGIKNESVYISITSIQRKQLNYESEKCVV